MKEQNHLNMDGGAQGGDNENQVPQIAGLDPRLVDSTATGGPIAGMSSTGSGSQAAGSVTGADNAGASFNANAVTDNNALQSGADTKSDQTDYSTTISNDDLLSSTDGNGQASGITGAGSVENAAVSMGDINKGAGAGTGPLTGG